MLAKLFFSLPSNILDRILLLKHDYVGLPSNLIPFQTFTIGILLALLLTYVSYSLGKKVVSKIISVEHLEFDYLIYIAIGYIIFCTGISIIGFLSLLNTVALNAYLLLILLIALSPFSNIRQMISDLLNSFKKTLSPLTKNKFLFLWLVLFVFLAIVMLVNPEIREDQYHVDFPRIYLNNQTIMIPPKEQLHVSASPMLAEMSYIAGIFLWSVESARYIHFTFYLFTLLTLLEFSKLRKHEFAIYVPLIFVTAPVVIHETSSMYTDFQWLFFFLLSILILLSKPLSVKKTTLSGIMLGAMVSVKLWTIIFLPVSIIFLSVITRGSLPKKIKSILFLGLGVIGISFLWFLRAFILTGNPIFPAFTSMTGLGYLNEYYGISHYLGINFFLLNPLSLINVFSPLFFLGLVFILYQLKENLKLLSLNLFKYSLTLLATYLVIQYIYGRYLMGLYVLLIFVASIGFYGVLKKFKSIKILLSLFLLLFFLYYFISQLLILPYTFGLASKNNYLTRILSRDNSSYYDFGGKFNKYISKNDYVATFKIFGYYYADFKFIDVNFIFDRNKDFDDLKQKGITKLFIKGGDINYFCDTAGILNCSKNKYELISSYNEFPTYYLYAIK